jgi:hypothetical protein
MPIRASLLIGVCLSRPRLQSRSPWAREWEAELIKVALDPRHCQNRDAAILRYAVVDAYSNEI